MRPPRKVDNYLKEPIVFYCKDCEKIVQVRPFGRKFVYRCAVCGTKNVAFGTEKAIRNFYRYEEGKVDDKAGKDLTLQTAAKKDDVQKKAEESTKDTEGVTSDKVEMNSTKKPIPNEK